MHLELKGLGLGDLALDLTGADGRPCRVRLTGVERADGSVVQGTAGTSLRDVAIAEAVLASLAWPLAGDATLAIDGAARLERFACDGELPADGSGFFGRVAADAISRALAVAIGGFRIAGDARIERIELEQAHGGGHVAAASLELGGAEVALGALRVTGGRVVLDRVRCDWGEGGTLVALAKASLRGLAVRRDGVEVEADQVELPAGLLTSAGAVVVPELVVPELAVATPDVAALVAGGAGRPGADPDGAPTPPLDLGFLDRVGGQLDVDVTADIGLPVIGSRRATHRFRVPIAEGTFNYKDVESDLAALEEAFVNIEVRGQALAIERRIPLVPGTEKPLVLFDLEDDEVALARRRFVRLKALARARLPRGAAEESSAGSSAVSLRRLDFAIDTALDLAPPADDRPDLAMRAGAAVIRVAGAIHVAPGRTIEPGRVVVTAERVTAGPAAQRIGGVELGFDRLTAGRVELEVELDGFTPRAARLAVRDLAIANLRIGAPQSLAG